MAKNYFASINLNKNELQNARVHVLASAPASPVSGQIYYNSADGNIYVYDGVASGWVDLTAQPAAAVNATTSTPGYVQLAGDLGGTGSVYTAPVITAGAITATKIAGSLKPSGTAAVTDEALRALGTAAGTALPGDHVSVTNARTPTAHASTHAPNGSDALPWGTIHGYGATGGKPAAAASNTGYIYFDTSLGNLQRSNGSTYDTLLITHQGIAAANVDGAAGTASMRTLGTGAAQAAAGNDSRFHTQNTDSGTSSASFYLTGSTVNDVRIKKTATGELSARLGDDSGYANFQAANVTVNGNLTVNGTTTSINSNTLSVGDNIIELNNDITTTAGTAEDAGVIVRRYAAGEVLQMVSNYWSEGSKRWYASQPASSGTGIIAKAVALKHVTTLGAMVAGTPVTVTHSLNTSDITVAIREVATGNLVEAEVTIATVDTISVTFGTGVTTTASAYTVTIVG